jgi:hypothetical protein
MTPLPQNKIQNLRSLLERAIPDMHAEERISVDDAITNLRHGYNMRIMDAYVDSVDAPTRIIVFSRMPSFATNELYALVQFMWAPPEQRGDEAVQKEFEEQIEAYSGLFLNHASVGSSWVFRGSHPSGQFWKKNGYELQEEIWVKFPEKDNMAGDELRPSKVIEGGKDNV